MVLTLGLLEHRRNPEDSDSAGRDGALAAPTANRMQVSPKTSLVCTRWRPPLTKRVESPALGLETPPGTGARPHSGEEAKSCTWLGTEPERPDFLGLPPLLLTAECLGLVLFAQVSCPPLTTRRQE